MISAASNEWKGEKNMKQLLLLLLCVLLVCPAWAEEAPAPAKLVFSSFDGGGHEYTAVVEDPAILAVSSARDYGSLGNEPIDGAAYDMVFTVTGLQPGQTVLSVYGRSPIMENEDAVYAATVDEGLNVTLTPVRAISTFYLYRSASMYSPVWHITLEPDGYRVSIDEGPEQRISADAMRALMDVIGDYDLAAWDGFSESKQHVLDGETFRLEIRLTDGTFIQAQGENAFPPRYAQAMGEVQRILNAAERTPLGTQPAEDEAEDLIPALAIEANGRVFYAALEENSSAEALAEKLMDGPVELALHDYGHFEKVGPLPWTLPRNDTSITTVPGDVILYQGNQITLYYDQNTWSFTRLAKIDGVTKDDLLSVLGTDDVTVRIWIEWKE